MKDRIIMQVQQSQVKQVVVVDQLVQMLQQIREHLAE